MRRESAAQVYLTLYVCNVKTLRTAHGNKKETPLKNPLRQPPTLKQERELRRQGYRLIAGIDEAGRGPLAGPVVAAAVILSWSKPAPWFRLVRDSKQLTPKAREALFQHIRAEAIATGVGVISPSIIDTQGIMFATRLAMSRAVQGLASCPDFLIIDAVKLPGLAQPQRSIIYGDSLCLSIAAASILAKVTRDRLMVMADEMYPGYGFADHKGYATEEHLNCLQRLGPCLIHRTSFAPVREALTALSPFLAEPGGDPSRLPTVII